jgi:hypothetical protein
MAKLNPDTPNWHATGAGDYAERLVLEMLRDGLPEGFDIFHSVDWTALEEGVQRHGEIDVVVVSPQGHLALLEVKSGKLEISQAGAANATYPSLVKYYGPKAKNVIGQANGQLKGMRQALVRENLDGFKVSHLLVLTDHSLQAATLNIPSERIVDAGQIQNLCQRVQEAIQFAALNAPQALPDRDRLMLFLANRFSLSPDPTARIGLLTRAVIRLSSGLATWVPRIESDSGVYVVEATAGSGKTQLALQLMSEAAGKKQKSMYVCYNRTLADHIVQVGPSSATIGTFHEIAVDRYRRLHGEINFLTPGIFDLAATEYVEYCLAKASTDSNESSFINLDLLVIDEMQDMQPQWVDALASRLKSNGRMYVLGDSQQSVYERESFDFSGAVRIKCNENFRTPKKIVDTINLLGISEQVIVACCPEVGDVPDIRSYPETDPTGVHAVETVVAELVAKGVSPTEIAIVTFAGRDRSALIAKESIAGLRLKKFTGSFDSAGNPKWTDGSLLVETLYRFKGQAAPYVILCEVDFDELSDRQARKLFVGMTRAQLHLTVLMSQRAEAALARNVEEQ